MNKTIIVTIKGYQAGPNSSGRDSFSLIIKNGNLVDAYNEIRSMRSSSGAVNISIPTENELKDVYIYPDSFSIISNGETIDYGSIKLGNPISNLGSDKSKAISMCKSAIEKAKAATDSNSLKTAEQFNLRAQAIQHAFQLTVNDIWEANSDEQTYFQFVGEKGSVDISMLQIAKHLEAIGFDSDHILKETKWFKGIDDKWRTEISDHECSLNHQLDGGNLYSKVVRYTKTNGVPPTLGILLNHDALFGTYPHLATMPVFTYESVQKQIGREYNKNTDIAGYINFKGTHNAYTNKRFDESLMVGHEANISAVLHEIQHAIQTHEGHAVGSSLEKAKDYANGVMNDYFEVLESAKESPEFINFANNFEAKFSTKWRGSIPEKSELSQIIESHAKKANISSERMKNWFDYQNDFKDLVNAVFQERSKLEKLDNFKSDYDVYFASAGEVEARNTQLRRHMNADQRVKSPHLKTIDVPEEKIYVQFDDTIRSYNAAALIKEPQTAASLTTSVEGIAMRLNSNATSESFLHECGHAFIEIEKSMMLPVNNDHRILFEWLGVDGWNSVNRQQHEMFADAFVEYVKDRASSIENKPQTKLDRLFSRAASFAQSVSQSNAIKPLLPKSVKKVFDRMFETPWSDDKEEYKAIKNAFAQQIKETGVFKKQSEIDVAAEILPAFFVSLQDQTNLSLTQIYKEVGLKIVKGAVSPNSVPEAAAEDLSPEASLA